MHVQVSAAFCREEVRWRLQVWRKAFDQITVGVLAFQLVMLGLMIIKGTYLQVRACWPFCVILTYAICTIHEIWSWGWIHQQAYLSSPAHALVLCLASGSYQCYSTASRRCLLVNLHMAQRLHGAASRALCS